MACKSMGANRPKMPVWFLAGGLIILQMILVAVIVHGELSEGSGARARGYGVTRHTCPTQQRAPQVSSFDHLLNSPGATLL